MSNPVARRTVFICLVGASVIHLRFFSSRFYIESISYLKDNATIELFFLNAKSCIYKVRVSHWNLKVSFEAGKPKLSLM